MLNAPPTPALGAGRRLHDSGTRVARHIPRGSFRRQLNGRPDVIDQRAVATLGSTPATGVRPPPPDPLTSPRRRASSDFSPRNPAPGTSRARSKSRSAEACRPAFALSSRWGGQHSSLRKRRARAAGCGVPLVSRLERVLGWRSCSTRYCHGSRRRRGHLLGAAHRRVRLSPHGRPVISRFFTGLRERELVAPARATAGCRFRRSSTTRHGESVGEWVEWIRPAW